MTPHRHVTEHITPVRGYDAKTARAKEDALAEAMAAEGFLTCDGAGVAGLSVQGRNRMANAADGRRAQIIAFLRSAGRPVTAKECAEAIDLSYDGVKNHLATMFVRGMLEKQMNGRWILWSLSEATA